MNASYIIFGQNSLGEVINASLTPQGVGHGQHFYVQKYRDMTIGSEENLLTRPSVGHMID